MSPRVGRQTSKVKKTPPLLPPAGGVLLVAVALLGAVTYASTSFFSPEPVVLLAQAGCGGKPNAECLPEQPKQITYKCDVSEGIKKDEPDKGAKCFMNHPCKEQTPNGPVTGKCIQPLCCLATKTAEGKQPKLPDGQKPKEEQKKPEEKGQGGGGMPQMPQPPKGEEKPKQEQPQQQNQNEQCKLNPDSPECKGVAGTGLTSNELFGASDDKNEAANGAETKTDSAFGKFSNWLKSGWDAFTGAGGTGGGDEAEQAGNTAFQTSVSEGAGLTAGGSGGGAEGGDSTASGGTGVTDTFGDSTFSGGISNPPSGFWGWIDRVRGIFGF